MCLKRFEIQLSLPNEAATQALGVALAPCIQPGFVIHLRGDLGAGKTTLLKLLWMEEEPSSGMVFINGCSALEKDKKRVSDLRRKLGLVFEDLKLMKKKTLEENLAFPLRVLGKDEKYIKSKVAELLGTFNLYSKRGFLPEEISAGERKKLAIARAVINEPLIVLGDEPFGGLDENFSSEILDFFKQVNFKGTTVFLATHRTNLVRNFKGRIIQLENGEIRR
jgi:cell division transport system ATP-binding protein